MLDFYFNEFFHLILDEREVLGEYVVFGLIIATDVGRDELGVRVDLDLLRAHILGKSQACKEGFVLGLVVRRVKR